jgi:hypothetical protein
MDLASGQRSGGFPEVRITETGRDVKLIVAENGRLIGMELGDFRDAPWDYRHN